MDFLLTMVLGTKQLWGGGGLYVARFWQWKWRCQGPFVSFFSFFPFFLLQNCPKTPHVTHHSWMMTYSFSHFVCNHLAIKCRHSLSRLLNGAIHLHCNNNILGLVDLCVTWGCLPPSHKELFKFVNHHH